MTQNFRSQKRSPSPLLAAWLLRSLLMLFCQAGFGILGQAVSFAAEVDILTPRSSSTIFARNPETHLVLRCPETIEASLKVQVEGKKLVPLIAEQHQGNSYLHFRLPLKPGKNLFNISPGNMTVELKYQPLHANLPKSIGKEVYIFHRDDQLPPACTSCHDLKETRKNEKLGTESQESCASCHRNLVENAPWQHSTHINKQCLTCHLQSSTPRRFGFPAGKLEESCFACHTGKRKWRSLKHLHGPLNVGGCAVCHNPHGDKHRYNLWAEGNRELCITCHGDKEVRPGKNMPVRYVHGIIPGSGCIACHDPHATDQPYMLLKPINELCVGCHQGLANMQRGHPVSGHPISGVRERRREGRELSCASCHDPHGSPYRSLLIGSNMGGQICRECHK